MLKAEIFYRRRQPRSTKTKFSAAKKPQGEPPIFTADGAILRGWKNMGARAKRRQGGGPFPFVGKMFNEVEEILRPGRLAQ